MAYATIDKPSSYFNTVLNTGDNTSPKSITGFGFQPDLVWSKTRTSGNNHTLFDVVRGAGSNKELMSNSTSAEGGGATGTFGYISAFNTDGFTATAGSTNSAYLNNSGDTYVNWGWKANATGVSNTSGTITSTVSANTTSGFSIVSFTGNGSNSATVGHGLGVVPKMIIEKSRTTSFDGSWWVNHNKVTSGTLRLNSNDASRTDFPSGWINESPTSSTFSFTAGSGGTVNNVNYSGDAYIAYCFAEVKGFSKFGSYTGNGSTDGTFVYTGFTPAFVIMKRSDSTGNWSVYDNKRPAYNVKNLFLLANGTGAEETRDSLDFLSNGFKLRNTDLNANTNINLSGATYIYMCFASNPFVSSKAIPTTAR